MAIKLTTARKIDPAGEALLEGALAIADARESLLQCGSELNELVQVCDNIAFIKDTIESNGVQWYVDNCDPENNFAHTFNILGKSKEVWTAKADAAMEGIIADVWNKIKEWWMKFWNWLKGLFTSDKKKEVETAIDDAKKLAEENNKADADTKKKRKEKLKDTPVKTGALSKIKAIWARVKTKLSKKESTEALGDSSISVETDSLPSLKQLQKVSKYISGANTTIDSLVNALKSFKLVDLVNKFAAGAISTEEYKKEAESYQEALEKQIKAFEKYTDDMLSDEPEAKPQDGQISLAQIGVTDENMAHQYVAGLNGVVGFVDHAKNALQEVGTFSQSVVKALENCANSDKFDAEGRTSILSDIRDAKHSVEDAASMAESLSDLSVEIAKVAVDIEQAIAKAA